MKVLPSDSPMKSNEPTILWPLLLNLLLCFGLGGCFNGALEFQATGVSPGVPGAPSSEITPPGIRLSATKSSTRVDLSWEYSTLAHANYEIERRAWADTAFTQISTVDPTQHSFEDLTINPGTYYYYRISTLIDKTQRIESNTLMVTPGSTQKTPIGVTNMGHGDASRIPRTLWAIGSGVNTHIPDFNIDFARSVSLVENESPATLNDLAAFGTLEASAMAAKDNDYGSVGTAAGARLAIVRIVDSTGFTTATRLIGAFKHVLTHGSAGDVVHVAYSLPSSNPDFQQFKQAVLDVLNKGIFVVVPAGNGANSPSVTSPIALLSHTNLVVVTPHNLGDFQAVYSGTTVTHCAAIGGDLLTKNNTIGYAGGPWVASAYVAGLVFLRGSSTLTVSPSVKCTYSTTNAGTGQTTTVDYPIPIHTP